MMRLQVESARLHGMQCVLDSQAHPWACMHSACSAPLLVSIFLSGSDTECLTQQLVTRVQRSGGAGGACTSGSTAGCHQP
jgi:hypothetical protein